MPTTAIATHGLCKTFEDPKRGTVRAVQDVNLECYEGEIFGLLGPNGAGKTTTLRMLSTILAPSSGSASLAGVDVGSDPIGVRSHLGFLSGSTGLYPRLTPRETLIYFGKLHGMAGDALTSRVESLIEQFKISSFSDGRCETLSTGQKQRVSIARAVLHSPRVLILDEPTTGLDILAASDMIEFIQSRKEAGTCVLFSTHILSEAERLCDRIGVIDKGRLLAVGSLEDLREQTGEEWLEDVFRSLVRAGTPEHDAQDSTEAGMAQ